MRSDSGVIGERMDKFSEKAHGLWDLLKLSSIHLWPFPSLGKLVHFLPYPVDDLLTIKI